MANIFNLVRSFVPTAAQTARASKTVAKAPVKAYNAYNRAATPLTSHLVNRAPAGMPRAIARGAATGAKLTLSAAVGAEGINSFRDGAGQSARRLAQMAGVTDEPTLAEIQRRGREKALPMAWKSVAPSWLGGDATPMGKEVAREARTIAQHNILPLMFQPSAAAVKNRSLARGAIMAAAYSPISGLAPYVLPSRPNALQMWNNVPEATRNSLIAKAYSTSLQPANASPLAADMQYIAEPALPPVIKFRR